MTISGLIDNYQKTEYVTALKKAYSVTNQALKQMSADMGCVDDLACTGLFANGTDETTFGNNFVKYFNVVKNCKTNAGLGCWAPTTNENYDGSGDTDDYDTWGIGYAFLTTNGMSFYIRTHPWGNNDCSNTSDWSLSGTGNMTQTCGYIWIDVNGFKGPNFVGRDVFLFYITNGKGAILYPEGGQDDNAWESNSRWRNSSGTIVKCYSGNKAGSYCAGRVMEESWAMNY